MSRLKKISPYLGILLLLFIYFGTIVPFADASRRGTDALGSFVIFGILANLDFYPIIVL